VIWLESFLSRYPELALFLAIGLGYWLGQLPILGLRLGPVTGSLFAGLAVGQVAEIPTSGTTKSVLFLLFLFGIGYSVGPQFIQALKRDGLKPVLLTIFTCCVALAATVAAAKVLKLDVGYASGLLSGALTQSPAMGTATESINALPISDGEQARLISHIAVADAICYVFGAAGGIWFLSVMAPRLLRIDLRAEAQKLEAELGINREAPGVVSAWRPLDLRAFRIEAGSDLIGLTLAECEERVPELRVFAQRVRRGDALLSPDLDFRLQAGDVVAVSGRREALLALAGPGREEIEDHGLLDLPVAIYDILVTHRDVIDRRLGDISRFDWARGLYPRRLTRGGEDVPLAAGTVVMRGDIVRIAGAEAEVETAAKHIGTIVRPSEETDFVVLGLAIFLGGTVGALLAFSVGTMRISLGTSVGTLLAGLIVGYLRVRYPLFGRIPDGAVSLMTALGLAAFVATTGLHAGPVFFAALADAGAGLLVAGMFVTLTPLVAGLLFGRFVLRMNPIMLLGGLAGSQTLTAGMAAIQERSGSMVAVLGYTPTYPLAHILLTTWGTVIVGVLTAHGYR
jgi:putative transport protein